MSAILPFGLLLAALTSQQAILTLLNSPSAASADVYREARDLTLKEAADGKALQQFVVAVTMPGEKKADAYRRQSQGKIERLAKATDNPLAWYLLSLATNDVSLLKRAVRGGNVQALNAYGTLLVETATASANRKERAATCEEALVRAYESFRKAATKGDPNGFVNLGTCYMRGFGCEQNLALAHECFMSAARAGHPEAMDYVAANYQLGHGVEKDAAASLAWSMKAKALRGDEAAREWLRSGRRTRKEAKE